MKSIYKEINYLKKTLTLDNKPYFNFHKKRFIQTIKQIKYPKNKRILEIGAGSGQIIQVLNKLGSNSYAVDYNLNFKDYFKKQKIQLKKCNIESQKLPYKDNSFDYVIICEVIEHLVNDIHYPLEETKRVLKKGGKLILTTPNACELGKRLLFLLGKNIYWDLKTFYSRGIYERHNREFTMQELKSILKKHNFRIQKTEFLASWEGLREIENRNPLAWIVSNIQKIIPSFRSNMLIIAKK